MDFGIILVVALAIASQFHPSCALQMQKGNGEYILTYHILTYSTSMTPLDFYRKPPMGAKPQFVDTQKPSFFSILYLKTRREFTLNLAMLQKEPEVFQWSCKLIRYRLFTPQSMENQSDKWTRYQPV